MKYNLIALDLDGTALSSNNEVQHSTIEAVGWARAQGARVVVATGRIVGEAAEFARKMGADDEMITAGGAATASASKGVCLSHTPIPWELAVRAAAVVERANLLTMAYIGEELFMTPYCHSAFGAYKTNEGYLACKQVVSSVAEYIADHHAPVDKLFVRCTNPVILSDARRQLMRQTGISVISSADDNLEVVAPAADKGTALAHLCAGFGIGLDRVIAIGDSENDLGMLRAAGMPVAMENASDEVKAAAKYITSGNNHGGVAQAIRALL